LETPFKVYIYCTADRRKHIADTYVPQTPLFVKNGNAKSCIGREDGLPWKLGNGKVIGEFVCDRIEAFGVPYPAYFASMGDRDTRLLVDAQLTKAQAHRYLKEKTGYAWHISDLVIYDRPKELSEFRRYVKDRCTFNEDGVCLGRNQNNVIMCDHLDCCQKEIKRPPQSWCYVEEVQNG
jgi:predicted transcriptional regulator